MKYKNLDTEIKAWKKTIEELYKKQEEINKIIEKEIPEYTCCNDEVVGDIKDYRICPTCNEHF